MKIPKNQAHNPSRNKKRQSPRADFHDYKAPGYYLITITAYPDTPRLSNINLQCDAILRKGDMIIPDNTELGDCVKDELFAMPRKNPKLQIKRYVIMPDHIHFVLQVVSELDKHVGRYIAPFTKACSQAHTRLANLSDFETLFKPFDDQIIFNKEQLDRAIKYIEDNPRRYLIRRKYPDLFQRHLNLVIGGHEYAAYGNMFLLKQPYLLPRKPLISYAFYPGTYFPSRLGSVAIYADNVTSILAQIRASKSLFGIPVIEARLEQGRRPFIDVRFAA